MKDEFAKSCANKSSCTFDLAKFVRTISDQADKTRCGIDKKLTTIYVQHKCAFSPEQLVDQRIKGLTITCLAVLICLLWTITVRNEFFMSKLLEIQWDLKTVTVGDFSIELKIEPALWLRWKMKQKIMDQSNKSALASLMQQSGERLST